MWSLDFESPFQKLGCPKFRLYIKKVGNFVCCVSSSNIRLRQLRNYEKVFLIEIDVVSGAAEAKDWAKFNYGRRLSHKTSDISIEQAKDVQFIMDMHCSCLERHFAHLAPRGSLCDLLGGKEVLLRMSIVRLMLVRIYCGFVVVIWVSSLTTHPKHTGVRLITRAIGWMYATIYRGC